MAYINPGPSSATTIHPQSVTSNQAIRLLAVATGVLTKAIDLQIKSIQARAFAEVFAKKAAEEAGKQFDKQNETAGENVAWYEQQTDRL